MDLRLEVYDRDLVTLIGRLDQPYEIELADERADLGAGKFTIPHDAPFLVANPGCLGGDNLIKVVDADDADAERFAFIIRRKQRTRQDVWDPVQVTGPGVAAALNYGLVYQPLGLDPEAPPTDQRLFGWMARDYDDSAWTTPLAHGFGPQDDPVIPRYRLLPDGWPDGDAEWVWGEALDGNQRNTVGVNYFRRDLDLLAAPANVGRARMFVTATSAYRAFVDGIEVASGNYWREFQTVDIELYRQEHLIAFEVENAPPRGGPNPGGLLVTIIALDENDELGDVLYRSFTGAGGAAGPWKVLPYPSVTPGVTPGFIVRRLILEAQARGALTPFTIDFDDDLDSNGTPWPFLTELALQVGNDTALTAMERLVDLGITFDVTPSLEVRLFASRGADLSASVELVGYDVSIETEDEAFNTGLIRGGSAWVEVPSPAPSSDRREGFVSLGLNPTVAQARAIGTEVIDGLSAPRQLVRFTHTPLAGPFPFDDYTVADLVTGPTLASDDILAPWVQGPVSVETLSVQARIDGGYDVFIEACPFPGGE